MFKKLLASIVVISVCAVTAFADYDWQSQKTVARRFNVDLGGTAPTLAQLTNNFVEAGDQIFDTSCDKLYLVSKISTTNFMSIDSNGLVIAKDMTANNLYATITNAAGPFTAGNITCQSNATIGTTFAVYGVSTFTNQIVAAAAKFTATTNTVLFATPAATIGIATVQSNLVGAVASFTATTNTVLSTCPNVTAGKLTIQSNTAGATASFTSTTNTVGFASPAATIGIATIQSNLVGAVASFTAVTNTVLTTTPAATIGIATIQSNLVGAVASFTAVTNTVLTTTPNATAGTLTVQTNCSLASVAMTSMTNSGVLNVKGTLTTTNTVNTGSYTGVTATFSGDVGAASVTPVNGYSTNIIIKSTLGTGTLWIANGIITNATAVF